MRACFLLATMSFYVSSDLIPKLSEERAEIRDRASIDVELQRQRVEDALLEEVKRVLLKRDDACDGRTHTVLQAVAALRADNVVPELVEAVDFTLDPDTFRLGGKVPVSAYYPVAETLKTIGNRAVINEILSAAAEHRDDKALRIYAWILIEIVGKDAARIMVDRGKLGRQAVQRERLMRLLKMIDERPLMERPRRRRVGNANPPPAA